MTIYKTTISGLETYTTKTTANSDEARSKAAAKTLLEIGEFTQAEYDKRITSIEEKYGQTSVSANLRNLTLIGANYTALNRASNNAEEARKEMTLTLLTKITTDVEEEVEAIKSAAGVANWSVLNAWVQKDDKVSEDVKDYITQEAEKSKKKGE